MTQKLSWGYFAFSQAHLVEVVMSRYANKAANSLAALKPWQHSFFGLNRY